MLSDTSGHTGIQTSTFTVTQSSSPFLYLFSVKDNNWIFASSGDGTCIGYLNATDLGLEKPMDIVVFALVEKKFIVIGLDEKPG